MPRKLRLSPFYRPVGSLRNTETCAATHSVRAVSVGTFPTFSELNFGGYEGPDLPDPEFVFGTLGWCCACPVMKTRYPYYYADLAGKIIILLSLAGFAMIITLALR